MAFGAILAALPWLAGFPLWQALALRRYARLRAVGVVGVVLGLARESYSEGLLPVGAGGALTTGGGVSPTVA